MSQLQDNQPTLDSKGAICTVLVKQNGEYVDWGDFSCIVFYRKNTPEILCVKIETINSKINAGDRVIIDRIVYDITNKTQGNILDLSRNDMESSFLKFEEMGIPIEYGIRAPIAIPLTPKDQNFVDQWMGVWIRNIAKNYSRILQSETIMSIKNRCDNTPAAIVGAGPSLDRNIKELKDINAIIISVDRAYKPLLARGINPDLVVSVDCHDEHILGYLNNADSSGHMLAMSTVEDYHIARMWQGRIFYYNMQHKGLQFCDKVLPYIFPYFPAVANAGCVVNTASIIANWMGCKPLILVGCDFSYPGEKISCDTYDYINGSFKKIDIDERERFRKRSGKIKVRDIYTYPPFLDYLKTIKELNKISSLEITNATEGGIIEDFPKMTLKEAKEKHCSRNIDGTRTNLNRR